MLSALLAGALITAASLLLGSAIMAISGLPRHSPVGPAAGISALLVICGIAVKLPGHAVTAAVAVGIALIGCIVVFGRTRLPAGPLRIGAIVVVIGAALVVAVPFATSGRVGILGQGLVNDDMASHLLFTEWIGSHAGPTPDLIKDGYPLGPHAIVAATAKVSGASLIEGFAGRRCWPRARISPPRTWPKGHSRSRSWRWRCSASRSACQLSGRCGPSRPKAMANAHKQGR
jgi:hypothetical protein